MYRGTGVQENLTTEASRCRLTDLRFQVFEWIKEILYMKLICCVSVCRMILEPRFKGALRSFGEGMLRFPLMDFRCRNKLSKRTLFTFLTELTEKTN